MKKLFKNKIYEKVYAPIVAYIRTEENIIIRVPIVNQNIKKGKKISITSQGKKYKGKVEKIVCECKDEFPFYDFIHRKYYKKVKKD